MDDGGLTPAQGGARRLGRALRNQLTWRPRQPYAARHAVVPEGRSDNGGNTEARPPDWPIPEQRPRTYRGSVPRGWGLRIGRRTEYVGRHTAPPAAGAPHTEPAPEPAAENTPELPAETVPELLAEVVPQRPAEIAVPAQLLAEPALGTLAAPAPEPPAATATQQLAAAALEARVDSRPEVNRAAIRAAVRGANGLPRPVPTNARRPRPRSPMPHRVRPRVRDLSHRTRSR